MSKAVVHKESTLGVILSNGMMQILHASLLKGSTFSSMDGALYVKKSDTRPATRQDFEDFRVKWHPDYVL